MKLLVITTDNLFVTCTYHYLACGHVFIPVFSKDYIVLIYFMDVKDKSKHVSY